MAALLAGAAGAGGILRADAGDDGGKVGDDLSPAEAAWLAHAPGDNGALEALTLTAYAAPPRDEADLSAWIVTVANHLARFPALNENARAEVRRDLAAEDWRGQSRRKDFAALAARPRAVWDAESPAAERAAVFGGMRRRAEELLWLARFDRADGHPAEAWRKVDAALRLARMMGEPDDGRVFPEQRIAAAWIEAAVWRFLREVAATEEGRAAARRFLSAGRPYPLLTRAAGAALAPEKAYVPPPLLDPDAARAWRENAALGAYTVMAATGDRLAPPAELERAQHRFKQGWGGDEGMPEELWPKVRACLESMDPILDRMAGIARRPYAAWGRGYSGEILDSVVPGADVICSYTRAAAMRMLRSMRDGDFDAALRDFAGIRRWSAHIAMPTNRNVPTVFPLVGFIFDGFGAEALREGVFSPDMARAALRFAEALDAERPWPDKPVVRYAVPGERALRGELAEAVLTELLKSPSAPAFDEDDELGENLARHIVTAWFWWEVDRDRKKFLAEALAPLDDCAAALDRPFAEALQAIRVAYGETEAEEGENGDDGQGEDAQWGLLSPAMGTLQPARIMGRTFAERSQSRTSIVEFHFVKGMDMEWRARTLRRALRAGLAALAGEPPSKDAVNVVTGRPFRYVWGDPPIEPERRGWWTEMDGVEVVEVGGVRMAVVDGIPIPISDPDETEGVPSLTKNNPRLDAPPPEPAHGPRILYVVDDDLPRGSADENKDQAFASRFGPHLPPDQRRRFPLNAPEDDAP